MNKDLNPDCLNSAEFLTYLWEDFSFILLFNDKSQADQAAECLINYFEVDEIGLLFHYNDESVDLEICALEGMKSIQIKNIKIYRGYHDILQRIKEAFDNDIFGNPMKQKMLFTTGTIAGHEVFQRSVFQGVVGLSNVKYISADRV